MAVSKITLSDPGIDKLPKEVLVEIFKQTHQTKKEHVHCIYLAVLARVCSHWRTVALGTPTLWADILITDYEEKAAAHAHAHLERSKTGPLFLTLFAFTGADAREMIEDLIIKYAERWRGVTLITNSEKVVDVLLTAMSGSLSFPDLRDVEISLYSKYSPSKPILCQNAPSLRRCRLHNITSFPPLPSNLVVLEYICTESSKAPSSLDSLLKFLPHVASSLEHLRFKSCCIEGPAILCESKILLRNLKSLLIEEAHIIMNYIHTPNLTYFSAQYAYCRIAEVVAKMFDDFTAPKLQSLRFCRAPLKPLLTSLNIPSMFPQLESVMFAQCKNEAEFIQLLEPSEPEKQAENPFPKLKELAISSMENWAPLKAAIEKRIKNGGNSLQKIGLPKPDFTGADTGVKLILYNPGKWWESIPPKFQDDFYYKSASSVEKDYRMNLMNELCNNARAGL